MDRLAIFQSIDISLIESTWINISTLTTFAKISKKKLLVAITHDFLLEKL